MSKQVTAEPHGRDLAKARLTEKRESCFGTRVDGLLVDTAVTGGIHAPQSCACEE